MPFYNDIDELVNDKDVKQIGDVPLLTENPGLNNMTIHINGNSASLRPRRIYFIDEVRGFSIFMMVFYHALFAIGWLLDISWGQSIYLFFSPLQIIFDVAFIFICGISCYLSRNNWKRGGLLAIIAIGITVTLWVFMPNEIIIYGILHFLATAILIFALLKPLLSKIPSKAGIAICIIFFLLTYWVPVYQGSVFGMKGLLEWPVPSILTQQKWLYPIGFGYIACSDYFPILPWIFCFLAGTFVGVRAKEGRFPEWTYRRRVPFFSFIGKHTLLIYVTHLPLIYGIGLLCKYIVQLLSGR